MGRPISITIPHALGRAEARRRIEEGFGRLQQQLGAGALGHVERSWQDDRLAFTARALGQPITGRLDVEEEAVRMEVDLPGFLGAIAERIKGRLRKEGQLLLEKK
jgi:hypothetical protein